MIPFIHRQIAPTILEAAKYFPVLCITGPRQSGKSTLVQHLFPTYACYSLDEFHVQSFAQQDPIAFLNQHPEGLILDEIQQLPILLTYIKNIVDKDPNRKFILSGSSNFVLLKNISESLAGRVGLFELLPMSFEETRKIFQDKSLDEIMWNGFYPAVCAEKNIPSLLYPSYTKTYLEKDVRSLVNVKNLSQFHIFLKLCAARIGSIFNANELAGEVGVASNTIAAWLSILEASYIIFRLQPWSENTRKRLTKTPKIYFYDTGLACYLLDIENPQQLSRDKMRGHLFENFIIMEMIKRRYNSGKGNNLFFFRDAKGNEVDMLAKNGNSLDAYEIKSSLTYNSSFAAVLDKLPILLSTPVQRRAIIYAGDFENVMGDIEVVNYKHWGNEH